MKDFDKVISGLTKSGMLSGLAGGVAGGGLASMLMGKSSKKMGKKALKVGALAAVGGLAWKAYQSYSQNQKAQAAPSGRPQLNYQSGRLSADHFDAAIEQDDPNQGAMLLLRAMIAAAYADGHVDAAEQQKIFAQVEQMDLSTSEKAGLFDELRNPMSLDALVDKVPNSETAMEVYTASVLAIDEHQPASKAYLDQLANRLFLPTDLRQALHQQAQQLG